MTGWDRPVLAEPEVHNGLGAFRGLFWAFLLDAAILAICLAACR